MKIFIKKSFLFFIPFLIWGAIVYVIDPFNYFNKIHIINNKAKANAENLNTLLFRTINFINSPSENILIGDSRTDALPYKLIEKLTKKKFKKLNTNATKLNEIFELFYFANNVNKINQVVIGINFNMFNKYSYENRVKSMKRIIKNPLLYIYNKDVAEACFYVIKSQLFNINLNSKPFLNKEEFWEWTIDVKGNHWYGKYEFPNKIYSDLIDFDNFTTKNNIELIFIIVPHHIDFHQKLVEFGLTENENKFKKIMSSLNAKVYDYDYFNSITTNKNNFTDPIHYNDSIGNLIVNEVWGNQLFIGKELMN